MGDEAWQAFSQRVAYEDTLPLALGPRDGTPPALLEERNLHVLATLATLEERRVEAGEDATPVLLELARLDSKLNVLMEIVGRLLMPDAALPPRAPVRLNASGVGIPASLLDPARQAGLLKLHFDACRALPLVLPVRFERLYDEGCAFLAFDGVGQGVGEGLERVVFRQHRRKVAEARQSAS